MTGARNILFSYLLNVLPFFESALIPPSLTHIGPSETLGTHITHASLFEVAQHTLPLPSMACLVSLQLLLLAISFFLCSVRAQCQEDEPCVHFKVVRSTNTNLFPKRAVEVQLANRSDVAYYAQCTCIVLFFLFVQIG